MSRKAFWEDRYTEEIYAYGKEPNAYFKQIIDTLTPGKILLAAEGEGRNAVYAATLGWEVYAYDFSEMAHKKAIQLATEKGVSIQYQIASLSDLEFPDQFFDAIGLIYVHFPDSIRFENHNRLSKLLKNGGHVILEAFSLNHPKYQLQNPAVGGPKMETQLYSEGKLKNDFRQLTFTELNEKKIHLSEGKYHNGITTVIRMFAKKTI
jgi:2-polyprenyl-3-methyl-5-hydroxy-6-metoxy-1,4-benzoquinol methylase